MDRPGFQGYNYQSYPMMTTAPPSTDLTATSRYTTNHGTSSAFSANANPNEDWTKISDLAERRRIQNRIAQRNYRKKLKSRLEDLERRAGSTSASPEPAQLEQPKPRAKKSQSPKVNGTATRKRKTPTVVSNNTSWNSSHSPLQQQNAYGTVLEASGANNSIYSEQLNSRQIATSSPPESFFYQSYSSYPEVYGHQNSYPSPQHLHHNAFQAVPHSHYGEISGQVASQHHLNDLSQSKQTNSLSDEQDLNPLYLDYTSIAGLDIPVSQQLQYGQQIQTPPLTNAYSDGYTSSASPARSLNEHFPLTPEHISYI